MMLESGCSCGRVCYEAGGAPFHATLCHCADCRRAAAAPVVAWFTVRSADFRLTAGRPRSFASSAKGTRNFCPDCGTPLTFRSSDLPDEIDVATCSLDRPELVPPRDHTRVGSRLPWFRSAGGLPEYRASRGDG